MTTAKDYQASFGRRKPNPDEAAELSRLRELDVQALAKKDVITVADIQTLEWGGRFEIANKYFDKCDEAARNALLHDQHHGVRSAAALFKPAARPAPKVPTAQAKVADIALAIMNGKDRVQTLHGEKSVAGIKAMILSTHPLTALERAEAFIAGFEGDELQEGVADLLAEIRAAISQIR